MGFLGMFGKKSEPEMVQIKLEELPVWAERALGKDISSSKDRASSVVGDISDSFKSIRQSSEVLATASLYGGDRLHTSANMLKDSFVKKTISIAEQFQAYQGPTDSASLKEYHDKAIRAIEDMKQTTPKQAVLLSRYFKKESEMVVDNIKKAEQQLGTLKDLVAGGSAGGFIDNIQSNIRDMKSIRQRMEELSKGMDGFKEKSSQAKKLKEEKDKEYLSLLRSREWNKIGEQEKKMQALREESVRAEMDIRNELAALRRPLKRLEHDFASSLTKHEKETIGRFLAEPFDAYMLDGGETSLMLLLQTLSNKLSTGNIDLKDSDREKVSNMIKEEALSNLRAKLVKTREGMDALRKEMEPNSEILKRKDSLEYDIKRQGIEHDSVEDSIKKANADLSAMKDELDRKKRTLEQMILDKTGKIIRVAY